MPHIASPTIDGFFPSSGTAGSVITITGSNFSAKPSENEVTFNNVPGIVTSSSTTQLKTLVPEGTSSGKIGILINGQKTTSVTNFEILGDIPCAGLVAYYPFNGNANDESGQNHNGVVVGSVLNTDRFGKDGKCYFFDGIDDYIAIGNPEALRIAPSITVAAWLKVTGSPFSVYLLSKTGKGANGEYVGYNFITYKNALMDVYSHGLVLSGANSGVIYSEGTWPPNEWTFLTVSLENDHTKIYVNGIKILDGFGARSLATLDVSLGDVLIGKGGEDGLANPFSGSIDEVAIYNRALSEMEVSNFYEVSKQR